MARRKVEQGTYPRGYMNVKKRFPLTYNTWRGMRHRCNSKNASDYKHYGGKGITVCEEWADFWTFLRDMGCRPGKEFTLDRIDRNKGYTKKNCQWITQDEQLLNYSKNRIVTFRGKEMPLKSAVNMTDLNYHTVLNRIDMYGWTVEEALTTPVYGRRKK